MRKNNVIKILTIIILIISVINVLCSCFAYDKQTKTIKYMGDCELYLKYKDNYKLIHYAAYEQDGKMYPAYCLNPEFGGVGTDGRTEYEVNCNEKITNENVWRAIINGYPYKTLDELGVENEKEAYSATQFAIYTMLENRNPEDYSSDNTEASIRTYNAYLDIVKAAKMSNESINSSLNINILSESSNWNIESENSNYISKIYKLQNENVSGNYRIEISGNLPDDLKITDLNGNERNEFDVSEKFKISVPIKNLTKDYDISIKTFATLNTKPIVYGKTTIEGTQNYALTGYVYEEAETVHQDVIPKNNTKIKIIKQEEGSGKRLKGVSFNLLNSNNDIVLQNLTTNDNGEIIEYLEPGLYYLQEIETLENYKLYSDPIEVELKYNEEIEIIVENSLLDIEIERKENTSIDYSKKLPVTGY